MLFNLVFSWFYAVLYDLSSLGNFYSFSVDKVVLTLKGGELFAPGRLLDSALNLVIDFVNN